MNQELQQAVQRLFQEGKVKTVIGYREHPATKAVVPARISSAEDASTLIFDRRCVYNLTRQVARDLPGPVGVVVKGCDGRSLSMRITELDFPRGHVVPIAVACSGVLGEGRDMAERCERCRVRVSPIADVTVGDPKACGAATRTRKDAIQIVATMTPMERAQFWRRSFEHCTHCFACREACPLCNCSVCITDKNVPQWIERAPKGSSNMMWHLIRAFHHAGRCVDCGECERACPEGIPMHLLDLCMNEDVEEMFGFVTGAKEGEKWPILSHKPDDPDSWLGGGHRG